MPLSRSQLTNALLTLTPQQITDLYKFEHFKKWTCDLFALAHHVNYSTAHRRLHKLMRAGAIMVKVGNPLPSGGRETDLYYPTPTGARMITRLRDRAKNYVVPPDVSNPIDNVHDLATLEVAIRADGYATARAFQERKFIWQTKPYSVIPDVEFSSPDNKDRMFIEVEQTSRPDHIAGKYEKYTRYFQTQNLRRCWLVVVFPDRRTEKLLRREHEAAAEAAANALPGDYNLFWATLSELRAKRVTTFDNPVERQSDNTWRQIGTGFLECTYGFLPW